MIRKESFNRLGRWDEDFWMYFEDVDLCHRAKNRGGEIVLLKNAVVNHRHGGSSRINPEITAMTKTEVHISRHLYVSKYENNWNAFLMHSILIFYNLFLLLLPALMGVLFFFVRKLNVCTQIYLNLVNYYIGVLKTGKWMSRKSVNYGGNQDDSEFIKIATLRNQPDHSITTGF
jgi:GT2 family glycosyltransferase